MFFVCVVLFFALISSGSIFFFISFDFNYEKALPITCLSLVLILFLFGILDILYFGFFFILLISTLIYLVFLFFSIRQIKLNGYKAFFHKLRTRIFTPTMFVFLFFFSLSILCNYGKRVSAWDEFSHWALVVKQMCVIDALSTNPNATNLLFNSYPPAMALFQYLFQKLYIVFANGQFNEGLLYSAYQIFIFALIVPFFSGLNFKNYFSYLLICVSFLSLSIVFSNTLHELYVDPLIGLMSGVGFSELLNFKSCSENKVWRERERERTCALV